MTENTMPASVLLVNGNPARLMALGAVLA